MLKSAYSDPAMADLKEDRKSYLREMLGQLRSKEQEVLSADVSGAQRDALLKSLAGQRAQLRADSPVTADIDRERLRARQGIAAGLRKLETTGSLTEDLLKQARQRASAAGVGEEEFDSFLKREDIGVSPVNSPVEASQNVAYAREHGSGLDRWSAMQDPNYKVGSASALSAPPRQIGTQSGAMRRAARRLKRGGYGEAASRMAYDAEMTRLNEPNIRRAGERAITDAAAISQGRALAEQEELTGLYNRYARKILNRRINALDAMSDGGMREL